MTFSVDEFMAYVMAKDPYEKQFHQIVAEVINSIASFIQENPRYGEFSLLERLIEPERVIQFRVPWIDDQGQIRVNRGYRVQMNSAIGPYKGGLRFSPTVNLDILKCLAFEQVFKNSLTTLPMGGAKGGSDFDGIGKSNNEVMNFCQSFMTELYRHIGPNIDVPAGDIGVGGREIGFLFGQYKRLTRDFSGVLTGKGLPWGGSLIRPEATGYGVIYFAQEMLKTKGEEIAGKTIVNSGYGNVGSYLIEKVNQLGGKVVTVADQYGYVYDPDGIKGEKLEFLKDLWTVHRRPVKDFADTFHLEWREGRKPWEVPCDIATPSAIQNELGAEDAKALLRNGCTCVVEAANVPCTPEAMEIFQQAHILYAPGKAANAGGVATSGLEMSQNSIRYSWSREEVDAKLHQIMQDIHATCLRYGKERDGYVDYVKGANIGGFVKVADAMLDQGIC